MNIMGKTKSGKTIFFDANHPDHKSFTPYEHFQAMNALSEFYRSIQAEMIWADTDTYAELEYILKAIENQQSIHLKQINKKGV